MATLNVGMKINRTFTATTTVNTGCFAVVTYNFASATSAATRSGETYSVAPITRIFAAGQSVPTTLTIPHFIGWDGGGTPEAATNASFSIQSGVEFINTI